ncbi:hypothetical protein [uncultured Alistipes sp.]|uniref:hypothetical protein n=1 Tax=uncultured Alistipes sp. TaxID=538949 RepID=UPI0026259B34|nr:hypothetical protein [uncultured Alistipes sp.]
MDIKEETFSTLPSWIWDYLAQYDFYIEAIQIPRHDSNSIRALLPKILKAVKKDIELPDERRTINMLSNIGSSMQVEEGRLLVSLFCDSYCQRDPQIHTRIVDDIFAPEFTESPRNADYNYDFLEQEPSGSLINGGGIKSECTFYREHKTRSHEPFVPCEPCHGSGRIKCTACGGSGREKYVDGYFASGEERIKTGTCSECHGHGHVTCPDCHGQGRIEIFAPNYSVEKYVDDVITQKTGIAYASPWMDSYITYSNEEDNSYYEKDLKAEIQHAVWDEEYVSLKMKNGKEKAKDTTQEIETQFKQIGLLDLYKKNRECMQMEKGFICRQERHYVIPIKHLCINTRRLFKRSDVSYDFYIVPDNAQTCQVLVSMYGIDRTGKFEYLITKLFKKSHL